MSVETRARDLLASEILTKIVHSTAILLPVIERTFLAFSKRMICSAEGKHTEGAEQQSNQQIASAHDHTIRDAPPGDKPGGRLGTELGTRPPIGISSRSHLLGRSTKEVPTGSKPHFLSQP